MRLIGVLVLSGVLLAVGADASMAASPAGVGRPAAHHGTLGHVGRHALPPSLGHIRIPASALPGPARGTSPADVSPAAGDVTGIDVRLPKQPAGPTISGIVTRASDGEPVPGATVCLLEAEQRSFSYCYGNLQVTTGADGKWSMDAFALDWILYVVAPDGTDLVTGWYSTTANGHLSAFREDAATITVGSADVPGLGTVLRRGHAISGTVTRAANAKPVSSELVSATVGGETIRNVATDASGRYTLHGLPAASYRVSFADQRGRDLQDGCYDATSDGFVGDCTAAAAVVLGAVDSSGHDLALPAGLSVSGHLEKADGSGVCGDVQAYAVTDGAYGWFCGAFALHGLSVGSYRISISGDGTSNIVAGYYASAPASHWDPDLADASDVRLAGDIDLGIIKPAKGHVLSGVLSGPGGPMRHGNIGAVDVAHPAAGPLWGATDPDGTWSLVGLPSGAYHLVLAPAELPTTIAPAWFASAAAGHITYRLADASTLSVGPGRSGIAATLAKGHSISGRITDPKGHPVVNAAVIAVPAGADLSALLDAAESFPSASTDGTGRYRVAAMPAGGYLLLVVPFGRDDLSAGYYRAAAAGGFTAKRSKATVVHVGG